MNSNLEWWQKFFKGTWQHIQPLVHTPEQNQKEADFIEDVLNEPAAPAYSLKRAVVFFTLGAAGVGVGATLIVQNAVIVANWLGIPELIIGLTIVALGTSLPEYVTGITSVIKGHEEIAVGNIIGADILDIFWVLGPGALSFSSLPVARQTMVLDYPTMLILMALLVVFGLTGRQLSRWHGGVMLGVYGVYLAMMFLLFR